MLRVSIGLFGALLFGIIFTAPSAYAAPTPDSCFDFDNSTGTIVNYYNNEGNDSGNPTCTREVEIPTEIGGTAVTGIGSSAFFMKQLSSVAIPDSVTSIGMSAFNSNQLISVVIPDSVTSIGNSAFYRNQLTSIVIPNSITTIGDYVFAGNQLASVTIPDSVASIGSWAFYDNQLSSVVLSSSLTSIGEKTFSSNQLATLTIPNSVTDIGNGAFDNNRLTLVTIPNSVANIGNSAFSSNQLTSVVVPDSVVSIGAYAFTNNQLTNITVEGDPSLGPDILNGNYELNTISYNGTTYDSSTPNSEVCFEFDADSKTITWFRRADLELVKNNNQPCLGEALTVPGSIDGIQVTSIDDYAFQGNQFTSATIPDSVVSIGNSAFSDNRLTSVTIPDSVTSIGERAFFANRLVLVHIPNSVTNMGFAAFALQNQWGRALDWGERDAPYLWSSDPAEVQAAYDSIWYVQLYTEDSSNSNGLRNSILDESYWIGDDANNDSINNSLGGHIINPARLKLQYVNETNANLRTADTVVGQISDTIRLSDYRTEQGSAAPVLVDPENPTPSEQQAIDDAFSVYYRSSQTKTFTPPSIADYIAPAARAVTFTPGENILTFTYQKKDTPTITVDGDKAITKTPTIPSRPTFSGVATPGAVVTVIVHSDPISCTATADSNGNWSCTLPESLPVGKHTVYVKVINPDSSIQNLGPYSVFVRTGDGGMVLAPDSGVARSILVQPWTILLSGIVLLGSWYLVRRGSR